MELHYTKCNGLTLSILQLRIDRGLQPVWITLRYLFHALQPLLVPVCFVLAWGLVFLTLWSIASALRDGMKRAQQMHAIPCADCRFFTGHYTLKCPVHPSIALSEDAINCPDFDAMQMGDQRPR